jgi:hypothetical protein
MSDKSEIVKKPKDILKCDACGNTEFKMVDGNIICTYCGSNREIKNENINTNEIKEDENLEREEFYHIHENERKKEILRLINLSKKGKFFGKILNLIFPGLGFLYFNKKKLGVIFIAFAFLIFILLITSFSNNILLNEHSEKVFFTDYKIVNYTTMEQKPYQDYNYVYTGFPLWYIFVFIWILFMITSYYSAGYVFEPSNTLTDDDVLKYAPDSKRAKEILAIKNI